MTDESSQTLLNIELKAKLLQAQQNAASRFKDNIEAFRQFAPAIASQFEHYKSQQYKLRRVARYGLTVTKSNRRPIHDDSPEVISSSASLLTLNS